MNNYSLTNLLLPRKRDCFALSKSALEILDCSFSVDWHPRFWRIQWSRLPKVWLALKRPSGWQVPTPRSNLTVQAMFVAETADVSILMWSQSSAMIEVSKKGQAIPPDNPDHVWPFDSYASSKPLHSCNKKGVSMGRTLESKKQVGPQGQIARMVLDVSRTQSVAIVPSAWSRPSMVGDGGWDASIDSCHMNSVLAPQLSGQMCILIHFARVKSPTFFFFFSFYLCQVGAYDVPKRPIKKQKRELKFATDGGSQMTWQISLFLACDTEPPSSPSQNENVPSLGFSSETHPVNP